MLETAGIRVHQTISTTGDWVRKLAKDQRGLTVSAIILIGILVVAVVAFAGIAATQIFRAGQEIDQIDFDPGSGGGGTPTP